MDDARSLLEATIRLAKQAGVDILKVYQQKHVNVQQKSNHSPLTEADLRAHHTLVSGLKKLTPALPILSEEDCDIDYAERKTWGTYWLIDPLDGTREFLQRNDEFVVCIALIKNQQPVLGVIYAPVFDDCYFAGEGVGAFKLQQRDWHPIKTKSPRQSLNVVMGRRKYRQAVRDYLSKLGDYQLLRMGSAIKFGLVAEGKADLYLRLGKTSEWDTAAGQCIVEQAGGRVVDLSGESLHYNAKRSLLNPHFIAVGDPQLLQRLPK